MDSAGNQNVHIVLGCQKRFSTGLDTRQAYGLVVNFWHSGQEVRLYQELRALIRQPVRVGLQPGAPSQLGKSAEPPARPKISELPYKLTLSLDKLGELKPPAPEHEVNREH